MRSTGIVPLLVVSALMSASCGGDGSVFAGSTTTVAPGVEDVVDARALAAGEAIVFSLGAEPGLLAVGFALDRGFTAAQIAEAGLAETLMTDGTIIGGQPALGWQGIFSDLPAAGAGATGGGASSAFTLRHLLDEPNPYEVPITADQWLAGLAIESDRVVSGLATPSAPSSGGSTTTTRPETTDEQDRAALMIGLIVQLSDTGYSAEQIILGIALGEVRLDLVGTGLGPTACWMLEDSATGGVVSPAQPAVEGAFPLSGACRQAIDQLAPSDTDGSTTTTTAGSTSTTTTTAVHADGIQNGVYVGNVAVTGEVSEGAIYEILAGEIRLDVTDQGIDAEVAFTLRVSVRSSSTRGPLCIATLDYVYRGQWPALETVGPPLPPVSQSIRLLEGPECGIVDPWDTTAEDYLLAGFAEERTITVVGSFSDGQFEGRVSGTPLTVSAAL